MLDDVVHELLRLLDVADVGLEGVGVGAVAEGLDLLDDLLGALDGVGVVDGNFGTALGELNGHGLADTAAWRYFVSMMKEVCTRILLRMSYLSR